MGDAIFDAGQSFGVWNAGGLNLYLEGDANDYVCKGMAGGKVVIKPPHNSHFKLQDATIIGNTCLYGATGGKLRTYRVDVTEGARVVEVGALP